MLIVVATRFQQFFVDQGKENREADASKKSFLETKKI